MKTIKKFQYTKTIYLTVVCLLISATAVPSISSDEPLSRATIYVDDDASPGWYDATHVHTVQEGINNATIGDTVYVYNGTYQENILINKTIILLGENKSTTFINGGGSGNVINITADSVAISFLTIKNAGSVAGIIIHSNNNTITNNTISNNQYYGIYIDTSIGNYIANNTIKDNGDGIRLWYASMSTIEGNNITSNYYGLLSKYGSNNTILNNTFYNNNNYGVILYSCQQATIEQNMITNSIYGIRLCWSSHTNTINGNYILSNSHRGIYFDSLASNNTVFNNYFNNTDNANDSGMNNCWNISQTNGTNIIGGSYLGGNYWYDYNGYDTNGDGIGDINIPYAPGDYLPLVQPNFLPQPDFTYQPLNPNTLDIINFTDNSTDPDGNNDIVNWTWDFGDGNISYEQHTNHSYANNIEYNVTLTIRDTQGAINNTQKTVNISNVPPMVNFTYTPSSPNTNDIIAFNSTSFDIDGTIVNWTWDFNDGNISYGENTTHSFNEGSYNVVLYIIDDDGATNFTYKTINVTNIPPVVDFTYMPPNPTTADIIQFIDLSSDRNSRSIINWTWDFDDGNVSYNQNTTHSYADNGTYNVTLTIEDNDGAVNSTSKFVQVSNVPPVANFSFSPVNASTADVISFNDTSYDNDGSIVNRTWDFDDGNVSYLQNPTHQYADDGTYFVSLTVEDDDGENDTLTKQIIISNLPPVANFSFSPVNASTADVISFNDTSYDNDGSIVNWTWDFDDGNVSYNQNTTHSYADNGTYFVSLTVKDDDGASNTTMIQINISNIGPTASFSYSPTSPLTKDTIQFTDESYDNDGNIVNWTWDFGDGNISYNQNPYHQYGDDGSYNVTLTVTDDDGATNSTWEIINVTNTAPYPNFGWTPSNPTTQDIIQFLDLSTDRSIVSWAWNFGDGNLSSLQHPQHQYAEDGVYNVTLFVSDDDGAVNSTSKFVTVSNVPPVANFSFSPVNASTADLITFNETSYDIDGSIVNWTWDFGDGNISYLQNPTYQYADDGIYTVNLTVTDNDNDIGWIEKQVTVTNVGPIANFSFTPTNPSTADTIHFTDLSYDSDGTIVSWEWDFGNGYGTTNQHPTYSYNDNGTYIVTLTVEDDDGANDSTTMQINVSNVQPSVSFNYLPASPTVIDLIYFFDLSSDSDGIIVNWTWDFGDGNISYLQNSTHSYGDNDNYNVTLTVTDNDGACNSTTKQINVSNVSPLANFTYSPPSPTTVDIITFTDSSYDPDGFITNWTWDFDDGNISYLQNPTHNYSHNGTYNVNLTVKDDDGATNSYTQQINVTYPPVANFSFTPIIPTTGENISFIDLSYDLDGFITNWTWDFGDGNISYLQNPTHSYADNENYTVNLTIWDNDNASNSTLKNISVQNSPPVAHFNFTPYYPAPLQNISFTDSSYDLDGFITNWTWDFGDGNISYLQNPTHNYSHNGTYNVNLTVKDDDGATNSYTQQINVTYPPVANFSFTPIIPTTGENISFIDLSYDLDGFITNWTWDFGDGNNSYEQNPTHSYDDDGSYNVTLTVTDDDGASNSTTKQINVSNVSPIANFTYSPPSPTTVDIITFTDSSYDLDGIVVNWSWDFGDGNNSYLQNPTHLYTSAGNYTVCLIVTDDDNATNTTCKTVNVSSGVEVIDVNQSTFNRGFPIRHAIDGDWAGAQNFTPILNTLTSVDIYLRKFGTPEFDLVVELREDGPEGNLLDSVTFTPSEVSSSWGWLSVDFNDEAVTPGTDYFIVVPPAPSGVTTSFGYEWGYCFGDVYPDGAFWFTRDGGTLWRDLPTMYEFTFRTYGLM